jgi:hypothetical protein
LCSKRNHPVDRHNRTADYIQGSRNSAETANHDYPISFSADDDSESTGGLKQAAGDRKERIKQHETEY